MSNDPFHQGLVLSGVTRFAQSGFPGRRLTALCRARSLSASATLL